MLFEAKSVTYIKQNVKHSYMHYLLGQLMRARKAQTMHTHTHLDDAN